MCFSGLIFHIAFREDWLSSSKVYMRVPQNTNTHTIYIYHGDFKSALPYLTMKVD
jgi:hypothetical protein